MLTDEQIKDGAFTPEQIEVVKAEYTKKEKELLATANKNADGILNGFSGRLTEISGVERKKEGDKFTEKVSDHFNRVANEWLPNNAQEKITAAEEKVRLAEEKVLNHKGDETLKQELKEAKLELEKIPDLLKSKDTEWEAKYKELETTHNTSKLSRSLKDAMPKFDDNVNQFELEAKKKNAIERIKTVYELSYDDDGKLIGTKEYQKYLISDLLKEDEELKDLILIDQGQGGGGGGGNKKKVTTLSIPEGMAKGAAQQIIREYMSTVEQISNLDDKYSDRFKELCKENNVL